MEELDTNVVPMLKLPSKSPEDVVEEAGEAVD